MIYAHLYTIVGSASSVGIRSPHFNTVSAQIINLFVSSPPLIGMKPTMKVRTARCTDLNSVL